MDNEKKTDFVLVDEQDVSDADIRLADEIGRHAAKEAISTMQRVLETVPNEVYPAAVAVAHATLEWGLSETNRQLDLAKPGFAQVVQALKRSLHDHGSARFRSSVEGIRKAMFGR